jgi:hypothetical protein
MWMSVISTGRRWYHVNRSSSVAQIAAMSFAVTASRTTLISSIMYDARPSQSTRRSRPAASRPQNRARCHGGGRSAAVAAATGALSGFPGIGKTTV